VTAVLSGFAVVLVVVAVGWLVGRSGVLGPSGQVVLARLAFFVGTPALLLHTLSTADLGAVVSRGLAVTAVAATSSALLFAGVARLLWHQRVEHVVVGALASSYVNAANLGIPLAVYVVGDASVVAPALLFQLAVLAPVAITVLDARASGARRVEWSHLLAPLRNPLLLGSLLGILLAVGHVRLPQQVADPLLLLADTSVPCALLAFGISLHGGARPHLAGRDLWAATTLKLGVQPVLAWAFGRGVLGLHGTVLLGVVLAAALPTAQNVFVYAVRYDRAVPLARDAVLVTTVLSIPVLLVVAVLLG
jgi:malonate transporter and related proteins